MQGQRIESIFWDVGGTLVDFAMTLPLSVRTRLRRAGVNLTHLSDEQIEALFMRFIWRETTWTSMEEEYAAVEAWAAELFTGTNIGENLRDSAVKELWRYEEMFRHVPGIVELLAELQTMGLRQAIVSNTTALLRLFPLARYSGSGQG